MVQPDRLKVGAGVILVSIDGLARDWGIPEDGMKSLLKTFSIPVITPPGGEKRYISLWSLEMALFEAGLPEAAKGSEAALRAIHEAAGIIYATASKEVVRERVRALAGALRTSPATRKKPSKLGTKKRGAGRPRKDWRESQS